MNLGENPNLESTVEKSNPLKEMLVDYVGEKQNPDNDEVTVEMVINTMADEFPEFLLAVAEENWIRGYHQALSDVDAGQQIVEKQSLLESEDSI